MELMFQRELEQAAQALCAEFGLPSCPRVRAEAPRDASFGFISSGVAFQIAKILPLGPEEIAHRLVPGLSQKRFELSVAGGGYINANPTEEGKREFFASPQEFVLPELVVDWEAKYLKRAFQGDGGEEARRLRGEPLARTRDGALQLLACLGDGEISATPFLQGLGGSENVPWFLDRYQSVAHELGEADDGDLFHPRLALLLENTLRFRGRLHREFEERRPERAVTVLLEAVRAFFAVYNRPEIREALRVGSPVGQGLRRINGPLLRFCGQVLGKLTFPPCEG